eukprot:m.12740 g.12740  ORF g.12740 m.12740 type:complete len:139 (-) comp6551_c0_seq1:547-963(-)
MAAQGDAQIRRRHHPGVEDGNHVDDDDHDGVAAIAAIRNTHHKKDGVYFPNRRLRIQLPQEPQQPQQQQEEQPLEQEEEPQQQQQEPQQQQQPQQPQQPQQSQVRMPLRSSSFWRKLIIAGIVIVCVVGLIFVAGSAR